MDNMGFKDWSRLSWFQKVVLAVIVLLSFIASRGTLGFTVFDVLIYTLGIGLIIFLIMILFNKFIATRINIKNIALKRIWLIIRVIIATWIVWVLLAILTGWSH